MFLNIDLILYSVLVDIDFFNKARNIVLKRADCNICSQKYSVKKYSIKVYIRIQYKSIVKARNIVLKYKSIKYIKVQHKSIKYMKVQHKSIKYIKVQHKSIKYIKVQYKSISKARNIVLKSTV